MEIRYPLEKCFDGLLHLLYFSLFCAQAFTYHQGACRMDSLESQVEHGFRRQSTCIRLTSNFHLLQPLQTTRPESGLKRIKTTGLGLNMLGSKPLPSNLASSFTPLPASETISPPQFTLEYKFGHPDPQFVESRKVSESN